MRDTVIILASLALGACASNSWAGYDVRTASDPGSAAPTQARDVTPVRKPNVVRDTGLQAIIGARASTLTSRFGKARIDLSEGDARKLQFATEQCVLDIYLYPERAGLEPIATHIEARLRQTGSPTDRAICASQIAERARR